MAHLRAWTVTNADRWNAFVEGAAYRSFLQLWEWGELRRQFGWRPLRIAVGESEDRPLAGAQILVRPVPMIGWALGYAPRGPIGRMDDPSIRGRLMLAIGRVARRERIATLKVDPEVGPMEPYGDALARPPWRPSRKVQPPSTRVIDLRCSEDELLAGLKRKHRQSVNRAVRAGVSVESLDALAPRAEVSEALAAFHRIHDLTGHRTGFVARAPHYYRRVWDLFAPAGHVRLYFAHLDGQPVATLFHFVCGDRVATVYGGMTEAGAATRANYLLRWEAMRQFRQEGFAAYDLWGLATEGIRRFKDGFGGEERVYIGARDLPLSRSTDTVLRAALPAYRLAQHARLRLQGRRLAVSDE